MSLPAAKCRGVDLRPAMSLALTFTASTSFFTLETSPFLQASNNSLKEPFAPLLPGFPLLESGVEPGLVPLPSVVVGELALLLVVVLLLLLLVVLLLLLVARAKAGEVVVGEAGVTSPSPVFSIAAPWGRELASSMDASRELDGVTG